MAIPGFQEFMLPLLKLAADGNDHKTSDAIDTLADHFRLNEEDRELMQSGSTQTRLYNRVMWAVTYLTKAGLLDKPTRGWFRIAPRGSDVLRQNPVRIDNRFLAKFDEFREFKRKKSEPLPNADGSDDDASVITEITPDEQLEAAYRELCDTLADELLARVRAMTPKRFEKLVVDVLVAMGYGGTGLDAAQVVGKSGDGGIDGVIKEDRLGLDMIYVQAKRHIDNIGPGAIREFVGSLSEHKASKGVFFTCGDFTSGAKDAAGKAHARIVLIDGEQLAEYMIDHGVGVAEYKTIMLKKLDTDYFGAE